MNHAVASQSSNASPRRPAGSPHMCAAVPHEVAHRGGAHRADAASSCDSSSSCGPSAACVRAARSKGKLRRRGERPGGREELPAHGKCQAAKGDRGARGKKRRRRQEVISA